MRFGANTFIWRSPFTTNDLSLVGAVAGMGFDLFEVACEDPSEIDVFALKEALAEHGLGAVVCGAFGPGRDLSSDDPDVRASTAAYVRWCIDAASDLGAGIVCGPMYGSVGKARYLPPLARAEERTRAANELRELAAYAADRDVRLAMEPLNRFETDMINVVSQGLDLIDEIGSEHVGLHLDTFHMHLEEKDSGDAIRLADDRLFHVHVCENDRGVPGTGQVDWRGVARALEDVGYDEAVVIESFTPEVKSIAQAVCIWRPIAESQDAIARDGLRFVRDLIG